jgi:hypothetical protein
MCAVALLVQHFDLSLRTIIGTEIFNMFLESHYNLNIGHGPFQ